MKTLCSRKKYKYARQFKIQENRVFEILMTQVLNIVKNKYSFLDILYNIIMAIIFFINRMCSTKHHNFSSAPSVL